MREKSLEIVAENHVRVRHRLADAAVRFDYRFAGEDTTITARVERLPVPQFLDGHR